MSEERFIPGSSRITEIESFHRYFAAAELCRGREVLDVASGEGYGSDILAGAARKVTGLDICSEAVEKAKSKYAADNLSFVCADACAMPFPDGSFDCVVSFETIEHLEEPERLLAEIHRVLTPSGFVIVSSPNKAAFDRRNHCENGGNIFHKHEMECDELIGMMKRIFPNVATYMQDSFFSSQIGGDSAMRYYVKGKGGELIRQMSLRSVQYSIVIGGSGNLPALPPSSYIDAVFDEKFGYQPDDEAVVNQFGLRGELDRTCIALEGTRGELDHTRNELGKTRDELEKTQDELKKTGEELDHTRDELGKTRDELEKSSGELDHTRNELGKTRGELDHTRNELKKTSGELDHTRDELEKTISELRNSKSKQRDVQGQLDISRSESEQLREQLGTAEKNAEQLGKEFERMQKANAVRISELERRLTEECAKSEYLWNEYTNLKSAWSYRIFGRLALRSRLTKMVQLPGQLTCRCGKDILNLLNISQRTRIKLKDVIYRRFGFCLKSWYGYQDWLLIHRDGNERRLQPGAGLEIPDDLPLTSIVIPVYNNLEYTLNCLHSLYEIRSRAPFEVIVVDDCSTEDYASALRLEYPQVRLIRNEKNSGFLLSANHGAREADGKYVLFLNNDTRVLPGWLDELATALYHHPEAGMIGSQLIHMKTGLIQESGNLICKNGGMLPLGRGCDPDHPEFTYFREVDFVSAASIIVRKKVFDEMNGFDTCYAPAYFEDPDLGLRLQCAGYRNYVMPLSRVMHMEMASYGDLLDSRCECNRQFFFERWKDYLAQHAVYETPEDFAVCRKFPRERIMYIDAEVPMADRGSGGMDAVFFMKHFLKRGFDVVFHGEYTPGYVPKYTEILLRMGVECVYQPDRKIWEYLESNGWTFSWLFISRIYQAQCFDRLLKTYCPQARYIFDTVDLHFVREQLEAELFDDSQMRRQAARTKKFELAVARSADATIVISQDEKNLLEKEYGLSNVWHIPQARAIAGRKEGVHRRGAVFIGSAHRPNRDALRYFHDEILPLLPEDFELTIVGEALRDVMKQQSKYQDLLKCPQFKFVGFVRDLATVLDTALLTVAPLRYGAGTKGKVASSMSCGVPCVSTDFGVEGTGMIHGKNILLARTPEDFARAIRSLCDDPKLWRKISDGGLEFLRKEYDPCRVEAMMDELFDSVRNSALSRWSETPITPKQEELPADS